MNGRAPLIGGIAAPVVDAAKVTINRDAAGEVQFCRVDNDGTAFTMRTRGRIVVIDIFQRGSNQHAEKENGMVADTMREIAAVMLAQG